MLRPSVTGRFPAAAGVHFALSLLLVGSATLEAQQQPLTGPSGLFGQLYPARAKTFIKASSDPDERPQAPVAGNDDGFSGTNACEAFRERVGLDEVAVLADIQGRSGFMGCFFRNYWSGLIGFPVSPQESNRAQILIDGLPRHDLPLPDYFRNPSDPRGQVAPFDGPFTANRAGGHLTHTPLAWQNSFQVRVFENSFSNAARFHKVAGTLASPEGLVQAPDKQAWEQVYGRIGGWRHDVPRRLRQQVMNLAPDAGRQELVLFGPATLLELRARVRNAAAWNDLWVRIHWDGERRPSVELPFRLLCGRVRHPFSQPLDTLLFGNDGALESWCYFPMSFSDEARITFENRGRQPIDLTFEYAQHDGPCPGTWGYFHAFYDRAVTRLGQTFFGPKIDAARGMLRALFLETICDTSGRIGVGMDLAHLEGDLLIRINGNRGDEHNFAATETSVGKWGWYGTPSDALFATDTSFNTGFLVRQDPTSGVIESERIQGSTFVFDPVHFVDGIEIALEHGVQNLSSADYGLVSVLYMQDGPARLLVDELDVGDVAAEAQRNVQFTNAPPFNLQSPFFRDHFFGTPPLSDDGRDIRSSYRFRVNSPQLAGNKGVCIGFRLDRERVAKGGVAQARLFVNGAYAGLLHSWTSNALNRWKEGGELEVELPRSLTDGLTTFDVEIRHEPGTLPVRVGAIRVYRYVRG